MVINEVAYFQGAYLVLGKVALHYIDLAGQVDCDVDRFLQVGNILSTHAKANQSVFI